MGFIIGGKFLVKFFAFTIERVEPDGQPGSVDAHVKLAEITVYEVHDVRSHETDEDIMRYFAVALGCLLKEAAR